MPTSPQPKTHPRLRLRTLDRGDGLLGLRPCGPVRPPARSPLFGARGPQVTVAMLQWTPSQPSPQALATAQARLRAAGLHPLPAESLQWRGDTSPLDGAPLWSLVREGDFADFWAEVLPALQAEGWAIALSPGFAHASQPVSGWQIKLQPLGQPKGMGSWMLSLGITLQTRDGIETLDLVPLLARLIAHDRRWTNAEALAAIADDALIRLHAPGGRRIDATAAPLKAIVRAMVDLLTRPRRRVDEPLLLSSWEAQRLALLRAGLRDAMATHPSARRDWALQGDAGLQWLADHGAGSPPPDIEAPAGLGITLRPYQRAGLAWLQHLRAHALAGILADDMGLGKTAQALAHLLVEQRAGRLDRPALVVCPASLIFNWQAEAARVAPALKLLTLQGPRRAADIARIPLHHVVLTSYPLLWRDAMALQRQPWHLVVLDEAQMVKNAGSRTATAARRLNARHRLCLTGTPMENHLGELWAQFHFLLPGYLGDARSFQRDWRTPIEKNGETLRAQLLAERVRPFILRRHKAEVATELPPMTEQVHRVALQGTQRAIYESVRMAADEQVRKLLAKQRFEGAMVSILDALLKLRQVCNDPRLLAHTVAIGPSSQEGDTSAKLAWLRETLPTLVAEGRRILVFSQFTRMLLLVQAELDALGLPWLSLTGDTPTAQRGDTVARFQRGEAPLFLVSLKAGGVGLNLTAADTVIHVDPWWNPAVEQQASARAHRIGQTRPVLVYRLVVAGSIEERLLALQARKAALADVVLGPAGAPASTALQPADVQALLAPLADEAASAQA
ncbi:MAG: helicase [Burkholderiales bacterium RIFCSPHIGHO2_12_FULL_69_20]|nr:MAG: helicase [Burkholderiales bacterium RIFCSPHIGHO2_12_FULL_69_20]